MTTIQLLGPARTPTIYQRTSDLQACNAALVGYAPQRLPTDPIGSAVLTLSNLPGGVEVRIRRGSKTVAHAQDVDGGSFSYGYQYGLETVLVKVQFSLSGFVFEDLLVVLGPRDQNIAVIWEPDPSYTAT